MLQIHIIYMQEEKRGAMYNGLVGSLKPKEKKTLQIMKMCPDPWLAATALNL